MTLTGKRILVPPTRVDRHPLGAMLTRRGAEVIELPGIEPGPPASFDAADAALSDIERFAWIVFVGSESVRRVLERDAGAGERIRGRIVALGAGTRKSLVGRDLLVTHAPTRHVGREVADLLEDVRDLDVLLVRREGASRDLPEILGERGARVVEVDGYAMRVLASPDDRPALTEPALDAIALGNPTAARFLATALPKWALGPEPFAGLRVYSAGEVTTRTAREAGIAVDITCEGRIIDLAKAVTADLTSA